MKLSRFTATSLAVLTAFSFTSCGSDAESAEWQTFDVPSTDNAECDFVVDRIINDMLDDGLSDLFPIDDVAATNGGPCETYESGAVLSRVAVGLSNGYNVRTAAFVPSYVSALCDQLRGSILGNQIPSTACDQAKASL